VHEQCTRVSQVVKKALKEDYFPIVLSGDHSSALGTISGIKAAYPEKRLGVIWIDAHADLHSPHTSPSGNVHGMPLAAALDSDNLDCQINEVLSLRNYKVAEVRHRGITTCVEEALSQLKNCDHIYISFDVDSLDCDMISYGTGTPVPKGFDQFEAIEIINQIVDSTKVACFEIVEVNPLLDTKGNKMAETAFEVLDAVTARVLSLLPV